LIKEAQMSLGLAVSVVAVLVSLISFEVNRRAANAAERHGRMPVLSPRVEKDALIIRNLGNGPALNIVLADATGELETTDLRTIRLSLQAHKGNWQNFRHLRPIPPDAEHRFKWVYKGALGLTYSDVLGNNYTLLGSRYGTKIVEGMAMPYKPFVDKATGSEMPYLFEL
jgi:hypothetical protein